MGRRSNRQGPRRLAVFQVVQGYAPPNYVGAFPVFALALLTIYMVQNIKYATWGRALLALREDAIASESVGVPTTRYKVAAFVIGAALAGLAGGWSPITNPSSTGIVPLHAFHRNRHHGHFRRAGFHSGSILAAILLTLMPEALPLVRPAVAGGRAGVFHWQSAAAWAKNLDIEKWRMVLYSLFIILAMLFRPQGFFGRYEITDLLKWLFMQEDIRARDPRMRSSRRCGDVNAEAKHR